MVVKIVGCAADSILQVLLGKVNQQAELRDTVFSSFPLRTSAFLCAMAKQRRLEINRRPLNLDGRKS
jgi:hypothetical protein